MSGRRREITAVGAAGALAAALVVGLLAAGCSGIGGDGAGPVYSDNESGRLLEAALDRSYQRMLERDLYLRLQEGLPVRELPDLSLQGAEEQAELSRRELERLAAIDEGELTVDEVVDLRTLRLFQQTVIDDLDCFWLDFRVTPYLSPLPTVHRAFTEHPLADAGDAAAYLALLERYPPLIEQIRRHLEVQLERGIVMPQAELAVVVPLLDSFNAVPRESLFMPSRERFEQLDQELRGQLAADITEQLELSVNPALAGLAFFLANRYELAAPEAVGMGQYPGGERCYRTRVRFFTTLDKGPEEIHRIGLAEMERLHGEMAALRREVGNRQPARVYNQTLQRDRRFIAETPEEVGERLLSYVGAMEARLDELFLRRPRAHYAVERLDPRLEAGMTYGYYRPPIESDDRGVYFYNGSQLEERSLLTAQSLIYHELVPGHHFQVALQQENETLHPFRRELFYSAFSEGWAEYAASLGQDLGLYEKPYDLYGRLMSEAFLTSRLVVDTGMNHLGWSRERAQTYMAENTVESRVQIASETLRYSVDMPGQALAYRMGALEIRRLREKAAAELGSAFDVRRFHDLVLSQGNLPLQVLAWRVEQFIAAERAATTADE